LGYFQWEDRAMLKIPIFAKICLVIKDLGLLSPMLVNKSGESLYNIRRKHSYEIH